MNSTTVPAGEGRIKTRVFNIRRLGAMPQVVWRLIDALGAWRAPFDRRTGR